jgi:hypothetical protein
MRTNSVSFAALVGAGLIFGAWTLAPVVFGAMAAVGLVAVFAADGVASLPGWALCVGAGCLVYALGSASALTNPTARDFMRFCVRMGFNCALPAVVAAGLLSVAGEVNTVLPAGEGASQLEANIGSAVSDLAVAFSWLAAVVVPVCLMIAANYALFVLRFAEPEEQS